MIFQVCVCWGGGSRPPVPPLDPRMGPDYVYSWDILKTHFIVRIGFCTTLRVLSIEREMRVLFEFRHFFNLENSSTYFKDSCIFCKKIWSRRCPWVISLCLFLCVLLKTCLICHKEVFKTLPPLFTELSHFISFLKHFSASSWRADIINGICADGEQAKSVLVFWRKNESVAIHR